MTLANAIKVISSVKIRVTDNSDNDYESYTLDYLGGDVTAHYKALIAIERLSRRQVASIGYNKAIDGMEIRLK